MMRPFPLILVVLLGAAQIALSGCSSTRQALGLEKRPPPDEFMVSSRAPLTIPPDFELRPPEPGAIAAQQNQVTDQAKQLVFGTDGALATQPAAGTSETSTAALSAGTGEVGLSAAAPRPQRKPAATLPGLPAANDAQGANGQLPGLPQPGAGSTDGRSKGEAALLQHAGTQAADPNIRQTLIREHGLDTQQTETFVTDLMFWRKQAPQGTVVDPAAEAQRIKNNQAEGKPITEGETPVEKKRKQGILDGLFE
jgi:hypothetical protein